MSYTYIFLIFALKKNASNQSRKNSLIKNKKSFLLFFSDFLSNTPATRNNSIFVVKVFEEKQTYEYQTFYVCMEWNANNAFIQQKLYLVLENRFKKEIIFVICINMGIINSSNKLQ